MSLEAAEPELITDLLEIMETEANELESPSVSRQRIAEKQAAAIKKFIKAGLVIVNVATTGTATAQTGTGTGNIE